MRADVLGIFCETQARSVVGTLRRLVDQRNPAGLDRRARGGVGIDPLFGHQLERCGPGRCGAP